MEETIMPFSCDLNLDCLIQVASFQLFMNFVRYYPIAGVAFLIFYMWKKNYFARFKIQDKYPKAEKIWMEIRQSAITLIMFSGIGITVYTLIRLGILKSYMYKDPTMYGGVPYMILSFILITIWHETYFYWAHRLMHHKKIYKYVHLVHHQSVNPTPVAAYNFHYIEAFFEAIYAVIFTLTVPIYYPVFIIHTFYAMIMNIWFHLGYEFMPKGFASHWFFKWINTSTHHNLHHQKFNGNYGLYLNFWDRIMGTNFPYYETYFDNLADKRNTALPVENEIHAPA